MKKLVEKSVSRRGVIRGLGGGVLAGVGKGLGKSARLAGVEAVGLNHGGVYGQPSATNDTTSKIGQILRTMKVLPEFKIREFRQEARRVNSLDADLASHKSVSLSSRMAIQRERNFQRIKGEFLNIYDKDNGRFAFLKEHGLDWF